MFVNHVIRFPCIPLGPSDGTVVDGMNVWVSSSYDAYVVYFSLANVKYTTSPFSWPSLLHIFLVHLMKSSHDRWYCLFVI